MSDIHIFWTPDRYGEHSTIQSEKQCHRLVDSFSIDAGLWAYIDGTLSDSTWWSICHVDQSRECLHTSTAHIGASDQSS